MVNYNIPGSNLTIRIEPNLKKEVSDLFQSLGLDLSTAIEMILYSSITLSWFTIFCSY